MGVRVNLAAAGVVGVTGLGASTLTSTNDGETISGNHAYALTGLDGFTINLPEPLVIEDFAGTVIIVKNLLDDIGGGATNRVTFDPGTVLVDGISGFQPFTELRNETFSFVYINEAIGWMITM